MGADADTLDLLNRALQLTVTPVVGTAPPAPLVVEIVDSYDGSTDKDGVFEVHSKNTVALKFRALTNGRIADDTTCLLPCVRVMPRV